MRVVIAEDAALLRDGLRRLLTDTGHTVVDAVGDADALLAAIRTHRPYVAVVDIRMPPTFTDEGLRAALAIRADVPKVGVLLLSQYVVERYTAELLDRSGAGVGYLLKDRVADVGEFLDAVARVGHGETVLDPEVVRQLFARTRRAAPLARLTERERQVLDTMAQGRSNASIAATLHISEGSVEKHIAAIFGKLALSADPDTNRRVLAVIAYLRSWPVLLPFATPYPPNARRPALATKRWQPGKDPDAAATEYATLCLHHAGAATAVSCSTGGQRMAFPRG